MKDRMEKEDRLVSDIMKDFQMVNPSEGFTNRVMSHIQLESEVSHIKSQPLISKTGWIGIAVSFCILLIYMFWGFENEAVAGTVSESGWLERQLSSLSLPAIDFSFGDLFSRIIPNSSVFFWILVGIAGIALLAFLESFLEDFRTRNFLLL